MRLLLSTDTPLQTTLVDYSQGNPGRVVYALQPDEQSPNVAKSMVLHFSTEASQRTVGEIVDLGKAGNSVQVNGREVQIEVQTARFTKAVTLKFSASDGKRYKWMVKSDGVMLVSDGPKASDVKIARFYESSLDVKSAVLTISDQAEFSGIIDDIVTTCCYAEEERRRRRGPKKRPMFTVQPMDAYRAEGIARISGGGAGIYPVF